MDTPDKLKLPDLARLKEGSPIADLQYEIWATFLRSTGQNLRNKQLRLIADSSKLIQSLQNSKIISKEQDSTEDSTSSHRQATFDRDSINRFSSPQNKILSRKSPGANNKALNLAWGPQLRDIEQNCKAKTIKWVRNMVKQQQKLKQRFMDYQTKQFDFNLSQKRLKRNIQNYQKQHEHFIILKKVNEEAQKQIKGLHNQVSELKTKNKALLQQIHNIQDRTQNQVIDPKAIANLTSFLNDKEKNINYKMSRIVEIEQNILEVVGSQITEFGCDKCCSFIRRIKDAMMKLRRSLQEQSDQVQTLYSRYKGVFCGEIY